MIKYIWKLLFGDSCNHEWELIKENSFNRREGNCGWTFTVTRIQILLKCKKCGKIRKELV